MNHSPTTRADNALRRAATAAARLRKSALEKAFSPDDLTSRPTPMQEEILGHISKKQYRFVVAGNQSGKSSLAAKELALFVERRNPYFAWPENWSPMEPLLCIVAGQDRAQLEVMWKTRILPFLEASDWQEVRQGQQLSSVVHRTRQDRIVFLSHNLGSDHDISHMQSYSAHYVWVDEMPRSIRVLEELQRRTDAKAAPFLVTFTQKVRNDSIRRFVENVDPRIGKIFRLNKLDNPIYSARKEDELAKLNNLSESMRKAVLSGDWITSDSAVYEYIPEFHGGRPEAYHAAWRHVVSVDPANRSKTGVTVWAECPRTKIWWCVFADYIIGTFSPSKLVDEVEKIIAPFNIIMRIYDSAAAWFADAARDMPDGRKIFYTPITHKANRKEMLIANFQTSLGTTVRLAEPWAEKLVAEIQEYERSENDPTKIIKAQRFHLLDTAHYFVDRKPEPIEGAAVESPHTRLLRLHNESLAKQAKIRAGRLNPNSLFNRRWTRWR